MAKSGLRPFYAGVGLICYGQAAVVEQAAGDLQLAAQVQNAFRLAGDADFLAYRIPVDLFKSGEACGGFHPLHQRLRMQVRLQNALIFSASQPSKASA
jgi:hypothetical protein